MSLLKHGSETTRSAGASRHSKLGAQLLCALVAGVRRSPCEPPSVTGADPVPLQGFTSGESIVYVVPVPDIHLAKLIAEENVVVAATRREVDETGLEVAH